MVNGERPDASIEAVLSQLSHASNLGISPEELLTRAIDGLLQVTRAPAGVASLVNPDGKLEVVSVRGIRPAVARTLPQMVSFDMERGAGQVTRPIRIGEQGLPGLEGVAGGILLPLTSEGRLLGLLIAMYRTGAEPATALPDSSLATFQRQLSTALQNTRVRQGLQALNMDLLRILTLAKILGEPRELEDTLTLVAQAAKSFASAVATVVWLADPTLRQLTRIVSLEPEGTEPLPRTKLAYGDGVAGCVAETGEALRLDDALSDPRLVSNDWALDRGVRSIYALPLRFMDNLVGVLSVWTATPLPSSQLSLLGTYCDHAALAIGHAQIRRDKSVHAEQLFALVGVAQTANEGKSPRAVLEMIADACRSALGVLWFSAWSADRAARELRLLFAAPADRDLPREGTRVGVSSRLLAHRQPQVARDLSGDPLADGAEGYRRLGVRQSVTLPLRADKAVIGVLHLGVASPLSPEHLRLVEGYGALAATALARLRARVRRKRKAR